VNRKKKCPAYEISGIDIVKRTEVHQWIKRADINQSIAPVIQKIMAKIELSLKKLPENLRDEFLETGIILTGGGACIGGMDRLIADRTKMRVRVASDPLHSVIHGTIQTLNFWNGKKCWWENMTWPKLVLL